MKSHLHHSSFSKGGIISKIRRRLTVQGDSETIDGGALSELRDAMGKAEDVRPILNQLDYVFPHYRSKCTLTFLVRRSSLMFNLCLVDILLPFSIMAI